MMNNDEVAALLKALLVELRGARADFRAAANDELLDVEGVAAVLKVTPKGVYKRRASGDLPEPVNPGKRPLLWNKEEVLRFLALSTSTKKRSAK